MESEKSLDLGKKVLVCDKDQSLSDIFKTLMLERGLEAIYINREELIDSIAVHGNSNLLILTLSKPWGDACRLCEIVKLAGPSVLIIALVDSEDSEIHHNLVDAGATLVISRPCPPALVVERASELVNKLS